MDEPSLVRELHRLEERLGERISCIEEKLDRVRTEDLPGIRVEVAREIATLKTKAGVWGLAAGVLGAIGTTLIALALRRGGL